VEVIPAIDIRGGRCVRLFQGDYSRETVFSESPLDVAIHWAREGAVRLHIVDLDGAKDGAPVNTGLVGDIASSVPVPVQLGGGIRTLEDARESIALGVSRIIMGTAAIEGPDIIQEVCRELGAEAVMVSVDARDGYVAVRGWTENTMVRASELVERIETIGVRRFVYTDVTRTDTLTEPNFAAIEDLIGRTGLKMLVAGGISSLGHLARMSQLGVEAAIVGKAVYTGDVDLLEAIDALASPTESPA
jgi:phosphoribosylformimino-5-aminoimidazole carboxamide ribotide isomerase